MRLLRGVAATGLAILLAGCSVGLDNDRDRSVIANRAVFDALPRYPGAVLVDEESTPIRVSENAPVSGWGTRFVLALPAGTHGADAAAFYARALAGRGWRLVERYDGPVLNYRSDRAFVSVNLENWRAGEMEVYVDAP